ncbi:MAG: MFS transporter [Clostridiaceae bacterium]|nr:MFS transporter [Clostridiaceae bacterium]
MKGSIALTTEKKTKSSGNYILFCISRLISDFGTVVFNFALSLYILDITGSATLFATILSLTMIPSIIINTFCGVLVDRSNKKYVVVACDILSGFVLLVFAIVFRFNPESIVMFAVFAILLGSLQALFSLTITASIPNIAPEEDVPRLNSSFQGIGALMRIGGPIVGAVFYSLLGMQMLIILDGICFIISGLLELLLQYNIPTKEDDSRNKPYKEQLKDVYRYLGSKSGLKILLIATLISTLVFSSLTTVVLPYITYNQLNLSELQVSQIMAAGYLGMIIGMVIISVSNKSQQFFRKILLFFRLELAVGIVWVFPLLPLFKSTTDWIVTGIYCLSMILIGIFVGFVNIPALSYIQTSTPEGLRASIIGVVNSLGRLATPLGLWLYGIMLEKINWGYIVTIPTIVLIVIITVMGMNKSLKEFFKTA